MNYKVIFNALIIVFIIHLLIQNVNYNEVIDFSNLTENFEGEEEKEKVGMEKVGMEKVGMEKVGMEKQEEESKETFENNMELKNELLDYAKSFKIDETAGVLPGNFFENNENTPNFESNVAQVSKFYKNNYDSLEKEDLLNMNTSNQKVNELNCTGREMNRSDNQPDYWQYQNELPMNGGEVGGIVGFNNMEDQYSIYDMSGLNEANCKMDGMENKLKSNDLRKPDVIN